MFSDKKTLFLDSSVRRCEYSQWSLSHRCPEGSLSPLREVTQGPQAETCRANWEGLWALNPNFFHLHQLLLQLLKVLLRSSLPRPPPVLLWTVEESLQVHPAGDSAEPRLVVMLGVQSPRVF